MIEILLIFRFSNLLTPFLAIIFAHRSNWLTINQSRHTPFIFSPLISSCLVLDYFGMIVTSAIFPSLLLTILTVELTSFPTVIDESEITVLSVLEVTGRV